MVSQEILKFCLENGLLIDQDILNLFSNVNDVEVVKLLLSKVKSYSNTRVITRNFIEQNKSAFSKILHNLPEQNKIKKLKIELGLKIEISEEVTSEINNSQTFGGSVKVLSNFPFLNKKIEVKDFVNYFRNRFYDLSKILQEHSELDNLISINKISGEKRNFSLIGFVVDKRVTKNKNILLEIEDMSGKIRVLVSNVKKELYEKADDLSLDSVLGFKVSGNREIVFANDIIFPEAVLHERKLSHFNESVIFLGDIHFGSKRFLKKGFDKFLDYLNLKIGDREEAKKIKYLFLVGDIVAGVGNYPNQERDLEITDLEEQFVLFSELLKKVRSDIKIIISPGNHEGVRLMEPQPMFDEKFAWPLYELKNVIITPNPCSVNIGFNDSFSGFDVLTYHGFSFPFYANNVSSLMLKRAMNSPEEIMKYLLKHRHLAPTHTSTQYYPSEKDGLVINKIPDVFVSAHTHKCGISYYNNILVVSTSCWEAMTPYQEKFGNKPDHCKVPLFNLKTRQVKILDFEDKEESEEKR